MLCDTRPTASHSPCSPRYDEDPDHHVTMAGSALEALLRTTVLAGLFGTLLACERGVTRPAPSNPVESTAIRVNQIGYPVEAEKTAVVPNGTDEHFFVTDATGATVYQGQLSAPRTWPPSEETVRLADFSEMDRPGQYRLHAGQLSSPVFEIAGTPYTELNRGALKTFYFARAGLELQPEYAGRWARPAGHGDSRARAKVHPSAASDNRPAGGTVRSTHGWYDAGDYNSYIVNSGISVYTLLAAFEHFPDYYSAQTTDIPESDDAVPDILDEALWNIRWMLTMQDTVANGGDGGVYHKLTAKDFSDDLTMPHEDEATNYVVQKSTSATLTFAATAAVCARVFADFEARLPGLADRCRRAAIEAWQWARANPDVAYRQPDDIGTGLYAAPDDDFVDELIWAAAELYLATGEDAYLRVLQQQPPRRGVPHWEWSAPLAWMSLTEHADRVPREVVKTARDHVLTAANRLLDEKRGSAYGIPMGLTDTDSDDMFIVSFNWGSNSNAANQALVLLHAYRITEHKPYLNAAQANLDYLLGRNAVGYCFVTGFGDRPATDPHHRPSMADDIEAPVPGFLVGGPQNGQQDAESCARLAGVGYTADTPAGSYLDHWCSYATNEVAINWNAPLVYVSGALDYYARVR